MTPELQKYYEAMFSMMATEGWQELMVDMDKVKVSYDTISSVTETHTLDFRRGQLDILNWLLGLKGSHEKAYEELEDNA